MNTEHTIYAKAEFNLQKVDDFLMSVKPDLEEGKTTLEDIKESLLNNMVDFWDFKITSS